MYVEYEEDGKTIKARVWQKVDTLANWEANTLVIGPGEQAFVVDSGGAPINFKIGDGTKRFSDLPWWIDYAGGQYVQVAGNALPTPTVELGYSFVGPGTYTHAGQSDVVAPDGRFSQLVYESGTWSLKDMGALPTVSGVNVITPTGNGITTETAVRDYSASKKDIGFMSMTIGQNIIDSYTSSVNTNTALFDVGKFYDKRNGNKGTGGDFIASKTLIPILGGYSYDFKFRLYNFGGIVFFDKDGVFIPGIGISTTSSSFVVLEGTIALPENVYYMGVTLPNLADNTAYFFKSTVNVTKATDIAFVPSDKVVSTITPSGKGVVNEEAVRKYSLSLNSIGVKDVPAGGNIAPLFGLDFLDPVKFPTGAIGNTGAVTTTPTEWQYTNDYIKLPPGTYTTNLLLTPFVSMSVYNNLGYFLRRYNNETAPWNFTINENEVIRFSKSKSQTSFYINSVNGSVYTDPKYFLPSNQTELVELGDSVTEFGTYPDTVAHLLGYKTYNCGVGGTRMSQHPNDYYKDLSFYKIADAIDTGNWTSVNSALDALISQAQTVDPGKAVRLQKTKSNLNSIDFSKVDIMTVFFGTNDFTGADVTIGTVSASNKDITTVVGALNYGIEKIITKYPNIKILVLTPTYRLITVSGGGTESSDTYVKPLDGKKLIDYCDAILQTAGLNHLPCKDLYRESGFNSYNHSTYFSDVVHPKQAGYTLLGRVISGFIKSSIF